MTCKKCGASDAERSGTSMALGAQLGSILGGAALVALGPLGMLIGLLGGTVIGGLAGDKVGEVCDNWFCSDCRPQSDGNYACS
jgi:phage tail tape-measure protein